MAALVALQTLVKRFGDFTAVDGISLDVAEGEVLGFLGPNGAGKSTTMKLATGFLAPDGGRARICGHDVTTEAMRAKRQLGYLPEGAPAYGEMTPLSFLGFIADIRGLAGIGRRTAIDRAMGLTDLDAVAEQTIETLSKGFKRRVGLAQAILHDPPVLILDEPTDGLDPNQKHQVRMLIRDMAPRKAIIISTHILEEVDAVCTRAVIIDRGRIVADGTADALRQTLPTHNAVLFSVAEGHAERARIAVADNPDIAAVELVETAGTLTVLRALAVDARVITAAVSASLDRADIPFRGLSMVETRLDDVFRRITTSDAERPNA